MASNKLMHPRNIYRNQPEFVELAKKYPDFAEISTKDESGKVHINFRDPHALRVLTKSLLHSDFGLNVIIPEDRLVPTLPLRLNYILWIEDLLQLVETGDCVAGIDIGTGACAVYPLLAATKNKWHMVGTESDETSLKVAQENVNSNHLQNLILLKLTTDGSLLAHCFTDRADLKYDFCMCNPPFYGSIQELCESRNASRPLPKNAFTGALTELVTEGGEMKFITKLINESIHLKENVKIFTTMVGHKASLKELTSELQARGVQHTHTEFCQGRTTRWGLAWTYLPEIDLQAVALPRSPTKKKSTSMAFALPPLLNTAYTIDVACSKVKEILDILHITYRLFKKKGAKISLEIKAHANTWSNQRNKRRQLKRLAMEEAKRRKTSESQDEQDGNPNENNKVIESIRKQGDENESISKRAQKNKEELSEEKSFQNQETNPKNCEFIDKPSRENCLEKQREKADSLKFGKNNNLHSIETVKEKNIPTTSKAVNGTHENILHAILTVGKLEKDVVLDMEYLSGSAGKDGMHQVVQYIKNNWK